MRRSLLLSLMLLVGMVANAQQYRMFNTAIPSDNFVFNSTTDTKFQSVYYPTNFTPALVTDGYIDTIFLRAGSAAASASYTNVVIKIGRTTATSLTANFLTSPQMKTVFTAATLTFAPVVVNSWLAIPLTDSVYVTNTENFVVEFSHTGKTGGFLTNDVLGAAAPAPRSVVGTTAGTSGATKADWLPGFGFSLKEACRSVRNLTITEITPTHAKFNWGTWVNGLDYELVINGDPNPPPGVYYYAFANGPVELDTFTPNTCYYVHMRTKCVAAALSDSSLWITDSFCTQPDCDAPVVTVTNEMSTTAIASWDPVPNVLNYEYAISMMPDPPVRGNITTYTKLTMQGLTPNKTHYVHVRAHCTPIPDSKWRSTPFHTANTTDVSDVQADGFALSVYPNPVKDLLMVNITGKIGTNAHVMITDLTGKVLLNNTVQADRLSVDMSNLPAGLYLVKYKDDVHTETLKAIKQ